MATATIEKQAEDKIYNFYLDSIELLRITGLEDKCEDFVQFYSEVLGLINPNTHFTTLDKLGPAVFYIFLKTRGVLLVLPDFLDLHQIKYHEFTTNLKKVLNIYPDFNKRDKKVIIKKFIKTILEGFKVKKTIHSHALTLFDHFYPLIQHTKEEIVASVVCTLTAISFDLYKVSMRSISKIAGIPQSSLRISIVSKIYPYLKIPRSLGLKSSFELIKRKIRNKTSLTEIKVRTIEEEIEDLWCIGLSLVKIASLVGLAKPKIIAALKSRLGDFQNYVIRYKVTHQEIEKACQLRKKGFSYPEIATQIHRQLHLVKKIVKDNLVDYAQYKFTPRTDLAHLSNAKPYNDPKLVKQLYFDLLEKIKWQRNQKIPLSKLTYLLLGHEDRIKKNISKMCKYLTKAKINRSKKTILGLVLVLSFPQIAQHQISNLVGVSTSTIRSNLKVKNLTVGSIATHVDLVIKEQINLDSMLDYFEIIVTSIREGKATTFAKMLGKTKQIEANIHGITRKLREYEVYRDEGLILATAVFMSCPSFNKKTVKRLITRFVGRKVNDLLIRDVQKEITPQKSYFNHQFSLVELLGAVLEERKTDVLCANCGKFVYLQVYQNNQKIFSCKHC